MNPRPTTSNFCSGMRLTPGVCAGATAAPPMTKIASVTPTAFFDTAFPSGSCPADHTPDESRFTGGGDRAAGFQDRMKSEACRLVTLVCCRVTVSPGSRVMTVSAPT